MESLADLFFSWLFDTFLLLLDMPDRWLGLLCQWYAIALQPCLFFITCNYTSVTKITSQCLDESRSRKRKKRLSEVKPRNTDGILEASFKKFVVCLKILIVKLIWAASRVGIFSRTSWKSWLIMQSLLYLGNSTGIESDSTSPQQHSLSQDINPLLLGSVLKRSQSLSSRPRYVARMLEWLLKIILIELLRGVMTSVSSYGPLGLCIIRWSSSVEKIIE